MDDIYIVINTLSPFCATMKSVYANTTPDARYTKHDLKLMITKGETHLLTVNSPPLPSSNSKTYPCTKEWLLFGACHATVTELFSAEHSSGMICGAAGTVNGQKYIGYERECHKEEMSANMW